MSPWLRSLFLSLVLLALPVAVSAESPEAAPEAVEAAEAEPQEEAEVEEEPAALQEERELQEKLALLRKKYDDLEKQERRARGDERRVVARQQADMRLEFLGVIDALVENLLRQESDDLDATALRKQLERDLRLMIPGITTLLDEAAKRVRKLRRQREEAGDSELVGIEQNISRETGWTIVLYRGLANTVENLESLGVDASKYRADLVDDVTRAAETVSGRLVVEFDQLKQAQAVLSERPDDASLKARVSALDERVNATTKSLQVASRLLQRLDQTATKYQKLLITVTGAVTADVIDKDVLVDLASDAISQGRDWVEDNGPNYAFRFLLFIVILVFFRMLGRLTRRLVRRTLASDRIQASQLLREMSASFIGNAVFVLGIIFGLTQMGVELGPILAGVGIAGFIVGFALQDVLGNFAAGVILLSIRPYDVGDMVEAAGVFGEVSHMSLVATTILTIDNQTLVIPNGKIWGDVIKNVTFQKIRRVDMTFRVSYADNIDHAESVLAGILTDDPRVLEDPEPLLKVHKLEENAVEFIVRPWVETADYWNVYWDVTRAVKRRFDEEGITIPLPQREVHVVSDAPR
jgi:small conductance mechanosensitive channel